MMLVAGGALLLLLHAPPGAAAVQVAGVPAGYTKQAGDCGYPVCQSITDVPGISPVPPTSLAAVAQVCNNTAHCMGFNSNGWLKRCLPPRCPAAKQGMEPKAPCDLYTKIGPPHDGPPVPPPPPPPPPPDTPIPDVEDPIYPTEEPAQAAAAAIPTVVSIAADTCELRSAGGAGSPTATVRVGEVAFGEWALLAILSAQPPRPALAVMERRWARWSLLAFASTGGGTSYDIQLRKPLGALEQMRTARYDNLTLGGQSAAYFTRAVTDPDDYIAKRIMSESAHGEASYLKAAKFLPPIVDYVVIGDTMAPVPAVVTMDGKLQRADGGDQSFDGGNPGTPQPPPPPPQPAAPAAAAPEAIAAGGGGQQQQLPGAVSTTGSSQDQSGCQYSAESKHVSVHVCAADNCKNHPTLAEAKQACDTDPTCGGINAGPYGDGPVCCYTTRKGTDYIPTWPCPGSTNHLNSSGWLVTNAGLAGCRKYTGGYVPPPPPPPPPPPCYSSIECRQAGTKFDFIKASYCQFSTSQSAHEGIDTDIPLGTDSNGGDDDGRLREVGTCKGGGGTVFDGIKLLGALRC